MKFFDAFAGIGGFHLGLKQAMPNAECLGYSEINKYAIQIYKKNFKGCENYGDIKNITELPRGTELLMGGFPCQAFSVAGKRKGFEDTRGTLFFELARLLQKSKPKYFIFENVKGLLSHEKGRTFGTILYMLGQLRYDVQWQVMDSQDWGLAQHRERVFIIGHLRGEPRPKVFPLRKNEKKISKYSGQQTNTLTSRYYASNAKHKISISKGLQQIGTIRKDSEATRVYYQIIQKNPEWRKGGELREFENTCPTLSANMGDNEPLVRAVLTPDRPEKRQNGRRFKENGEPSFTLTAQDKHRVMQNSRIRRLTPLECERLQGFPDGWTDGISDSQRYKCLGNAVSVNVAKAIAQKIAKEE